MRRIVLAIFFSAIIFSFDTYAQNWKPGHYYDTTFTKVSGLIKSSEKHIWFKKDKKADKVKIPAYHMNSYVAGADSFVVSRILQMANIPIVQVLINNPVKLYVARQKAKFNWGGALAGVAIGVGTGWGGGGVNVGTNVAVNLSVVPSLAGGGQSVYYLYGYGPDDLQLLTGKNFIKVMSGIMSDKPEIAEKIKDKTANINNLDEWIDFYNKEKAVNRP